MAELISLSPDDMLTRANEFTQCGSEFQTVVDKITKLSETLYNEWKGRSSEAFYGQMQEMNPHLTNMVQSMSDIAQQLTTIAGNIRDLDENMASQLGGV